MKDFGIMMKDFAKLTVKIGLNVQPDQPVVISSPVETAYFTRLVADEAYKAGAREVFVRWSDDAISRMLLEHADEKVLSNFRPWIAEMMETYAEENACFLSISATDPDLYAGIPSERIDISTKAGLKGLQTFRKNVMNDINSWCVISVPTLKWAKKVSPHAKIDEEAVNLLWERIFDATRVNMDDPVEAWRKHLALIAEKSEWLNRMQFAKLHYRSSNGTDLTVKLPENHIWAGGSSVNSLGVSFVPNLPTEEVFTMPDKDGVDGVVYSTKPLNYSGQLIENFRLEFKNGEVVSFGAEKGEDVLRDMLNTDEGSRRLGEVALVPYDSPISNTKILFYKTLFDENASCHFAFGKAYPTCIKGGTEMNDDELRKHGVNDSLIHVDFMVGDHDTDITGITNDGQEIPVFKNGNWA